MAAVVTRDSWHEDLKEARRKRKVTQQAIAQSTGLRQARISDIERGVVDPKLNEVLALAQALDFVLISIPQSFLPAIEFEITECEREEERKNGPRMFTEVILGKRADS